jgi:hypothetical protein
MKSLLKGYEVLSQVFMFGFLTLMLLAMWDGAETGGRHSMDTAVALMVISMVFIMTTAWTMSSTYINWKNRKGYGKV